MFASSNVGNAGHVHARKQRVTRAEAAHLCHPLQLSIARPFVRWVAPHASLARLLRQCLQALHALLQLAGRRFASGKHMRLDLTLEYPARLVDWPHAVCQRGISGPPGPPVAGAGFVLGADEVRPGRWASRGSCGQHERLVTGNRGFCRATCTVGTMCSCLKPLIAFVSVRDGPGCQACVCVVVCKVLGWRCAAADVLGLADARCAVRAAAGLTSTRHRLLVLDVRRLTMCCGHRAGRHCTKRLGLPVATVALEFSWNASGS